METEEKPEIKTLELMNSNPDEEYLLFYANHYWYCFFRLHYILCDRLSKMRKRAQHIASEEAASSKDSPAMVLRLQNQRNYLSLIWNLFFFNQLCFVCFS